MVVAWLVIGAVIVILTIVTLELLGDHLKKREAKRNDSDILKVAEEARRDFS